VKREISVKYESDPPGPASQSIVDWNNTEWIEIEVQSVLETSITAMQTRHFKNGTEKTKDTYVEYRGSYLGTTQCGFYRRKPQ